VHVNATTKRRRPGRRCHAVESLDRDPGVTPSDPFPIRSVAYTYHACFTVGSRSALIQLVAVCVRADGQVLGSEFNDSGTK